jgi:hypothetical protein
MDGLTLDLTILATAIVIAVIIGVLDRRTKKKGSIFGDSVTPGDWLPISTVPATPPPLPAAQSETAIGSLDEQEETDLNVDQSGGSYRGVGIFLIGAFLVIMAAFWTAAIPNSKISDILLWIIVIGIIVFPVLSRVLHIVWAVSKEKGEKPRDKSV